MKIRLASIALASAVALGGATNASAYVTHQLFKQTFDGTLGALGYDEVLWSNSRDPWSYGGAGCTGCAYGGAADPNGDGAYSSNPPGPGSFYDNDKNDNWGVHNGYHNKWVSGNADGVVQQGYTGNAGSNMTGNVLGHIKTDYDNFEESKYEIRGIDIENDWSHVQLMFDYDSWIDNAYTDGFAVSYSEAGQNDWNLLDPTDASDMHYRKLSNTTDPNKISELNDLSGYDPSSDDCDGLGALGGSKVCGFDGHYSSGPMMGVAMFDLTGLGQIDLRFSFASDSASTAEGINIDNIKITYKKDPDTTPGIPEPGSLALMMLGATGLYRMRKRA